MNRNLLIAGGVILVLAVGAYFLLNKNSDSPLGGSIQNPDQTADMVMSAFEGSGSVKCTFQDDTSAGTAYIKNGSVRVESSGTDDAQYGNVIMKNDTVWVWETGKTEGFMMENISQYQDDQAAPSGYVDPNEVREQVTQNNAECNNEMISDDMFNPPSDVTFQSFSSMMQDAENSLPEGFELPEGVELPEGFEYPSN